MITKQNKYRYYKKNKEGKYVQVTENSICSDINIGFEATIQNMLNNSSYNYYNTLLQVNLSKIYTYRLYNSNNKDEKILESFIKEFSPTKVIYDNDYVCYSEGEYVILGGKDVNVITGEPEIVNSIKDYFISKGFIEDHKATKNIQWCYLDTHGQLATKSYPYKANKIGKEHFYKYLGLKDLSLVDYINSFKESSSNILLLQGPPGLGKTALIKKIIETVDNNVMLSYEPQLLSKDKFYIQFLETSNTMLVIEDADAHLRESNISGFLSRMLNIGDGIIQPLEEKKIIITTNLPFNEIPEALRRPGRCFDVLQFREYTKAEALEIAEIEGIVLKTNQDNYTLAEIFNPENKRKEYAKNTNKVGFIQ